MRIGLLSQITSGGILLASKIGGIIYEKETNLYDFDYGISFVNTAI